MHDPDKYSDDKESCAKYQESIQALDNLFDICPSALTFCPCRPKFFFT